MQAGGVEQQMMASKAGMAKACVRTHLVGSGPDLPPVHETIMRLSC
jgi:hypothetical protein